MSFAWAYGPVVAIGLGFAFAAVFALVDWRSRRVLAKLGHAPQMAAWRAAVARARLWWRRVLWIVGVVLCVLAAAGPRVPGRTLSEQRGIDLVLVMDYSTSMLATDVHPSRWEQMKHAVEDMIEQSSGDRVAVVAFAGAAAHFPLTHDHMALRNMFGSLRVSDLPQGSNLGEAVRVARCLVRPGFADDPDCSGVGGRGHGGDPLPENPRPPSAQSASRPGRARLAVRARAMVVFTDGEQTDGDARQEVQLAARLGIEVYFVGVGTPKGARVPDLDPDGYSTGWKHTASGAPVVSRLDLQSMMKLSQLAGGHERLFAIGLEGRPVSLLMHELELLQRGSLHVRSVIRTRNVFEWFLFPGFLSLLLQASSSTRHRRVLPS